MFLFFAESINFDNYVGYGSAHRRGNGGAQKLRQTPHFHAKGIYKKINNKIRYVRNYKPQIALKTRFFPEYEIAVENIGNAERYRVSEHSRDIAFADGERKQPGK